MCTWAGYVGEQQAAPILLGMAKRQEGMWGGFYAGLVTLADDAFHLDKVVGTMAKLEAETDVATFPGAIGLVHSRTKSGGGRGWAQPFLSSRGGVACCAQGHYGRFQQDAGRVELGNELLDLGHSFSTAKPGAEGHYPLLKDGSSIHSTELACEAVEAECEKSPAATEAIRRVMLRMPTEGIYAFLLRGHVDRLFVANMNQRMIAGRDEKGMYVATSGLALPDHVLWRMELPGNTIAAIEKDAIRVEPMGPAAAFPVDESVPAELDHAVVRYVKANPGVALVNIVDDVVTPRYPRGVLTREAPAGYRCVERLLAAKVLRAETRDVPGILEGETAPTTVFFGAE